MIARNTNASATDFRLRLTPIEVVMDTVNRLAASVRINRTTQANNPELVRRGRRAVAKSAEQNSNIPSVEMPIRSALLLQSLVSVILLSLVVFDCGRARFGGHCEDDCASEFRVLIGNQQRLNRSKDNFSNTLRSRCESAD